MLSSWQKRSGSCPAEIALLRLKKSPFISRQGEVHAAVPPLKMPQSKCDREHSSPVWLNQRSNFLRTFCWIFFFPSYRSFICANLPSWRICCFTVVSSCKLLFTSFILPDLADSFCTGLAKGGKSWGFKTQDLRQSWTMRWIPVGAILASRKWHQVVACHCLLLHQDPGKNNQNR